MVHNGFNQIFSSLSNDIARFINSQPGTHTVHCIGHSLGGAVANLCAEWAADQFGKEVKLYTFGAPRVSLGTGLARKLEITVRKDNIFRVYHSNDPVPMLPPFPFFHSPMSNSGYYIPSQGFTIQISSHSMVNYSKSVGSHGWNALYRPAPGLSKESIHAWLTGKYDDNPHSITIWHRLNGALTSLMQLLVSARIMPALIGGATVIDSLAMMLRAGIDLAGEARDWALNVMKKVMRAIQMKIVETAEELTIALIRQVFERLLRTIGRQVGKALDKLR